MISRSREAIDAPCGHKFQDRLGKTNIEYPSVDCNLDCRHCGWNPNEARRRMQTGAFVTKNGVRSLHYDRND